MVMVTNKGFMPAPKSRVRNQVGHKYLDALTAKLNGNYDTSSSPTPSAEKPSPGLDLLILGVTSGTAMDDIDFALCRFTQVSPEAPLHLDLVQVFFQSAQLRQSEQSLTNYSMILWLCLLKSEPISFQCCEKMLLLQV